MARRGPLGWLIDRLAARATEALDDPGAVRDCPGAACVPLAEPPETAAAPPPPAKAAAG